MKEILLVDDNSMIRKMMRLALGDTYDLHEAESADDALQYIQRHKPDAMVLDVMMPGTMNGFQLCERIKDDPVLRSIHIVLVTACGQAADRELGAALGANAYFVKPFSPLALVQHLAKAMQSGENAA